MITRKGRDLARRMAKIHFDYLNILHQMRHNLPTDLSGDIWYVKNHMPDFRMVMRLKKLVEEGFKKDNPGKKAYLRYVCPTCWMYRGQECRKMDQPFHKTRPHLARRLKVKKT